MLQTNEPLRISGPKIIADEREVVWKNLCKIGLECRECIVEMSYTKTKFFIVAFDLAIQKFHVIELFRPQANKLIKAMAKLNHQELMRAQDKERSNVLYNLMTKLEFKFGKMCIRDLEMMLQYQLYMSPSMIQQQKHLEIQVIEHMKSRALKNLLHTTSTEMRIDPRRNKSKDTFFESKLQKSEDPVAVSNSIDKALKNKYVRP